MSKVLYEPPITDIILFTTEDVLTVSEPGEIGGDVGDENLFG